MNYAVVDHSLAGVVPAWLQTIRHFPIPLYDILNLCLTVQYHHQKFRMEI